MSTADWWGLLTMFLGGALPWLEAVVVIPGGILAGLPAVPVVLAATTGNLLTIGIAAWCGEHIRGWLTRRRESRDAKKLDEETLARREAKRGQRQRRVQRVMDRGGMPALAVMGPIIGTQFIAVAVVTMGISATRSFLWVSAGTVAWATLVAVATAGGFEVLGLG